MSAEKSLELIKECAFDFAVNEGYEYYDSFWKFMLKETDQRCYIPHFIVVKYSTSDNEGIDYLGYFLSEFFDKEWRESDKTFFDDVIYGFYLKQTLELLEEAVPDEYQNAWNFVQEMEKNGRLEDIRGYWDDNKIWWKDSEWLAKTYRKYGARY